MKIYQAGAGASDTNGAIIGSQSQDVSSRASKAFGTAGPIVVVDHRAFYRDCVTKALVSAYGLNVQAVESAEEWVDGAGNSRPSLVLLFISNGTVADKIVSLINALEKTGAIPPFVVFSEDENIDDIIGALEKGARGYIASSTPLDVVVEALRLVAAGGTFIPASSIIAAQRNGEGYKSGNHKPIADGAFTPRQSAIIEKLRIGKSNKLIAYELSMCESTVKVHVRNIMKKLNAKNRTEVAFMASRLAR